MKSIKIPESITYIPSGAFFSCHALEAVTIHDDITTIENFAFEKCTSLKKSLCRLNLTNFDYNVFAEFDDELIIKYAGIPYKLGTDRNTIEKLFKQTN